MKNGVARESCSSRAQRLHYNVAIHVNEFFFWGGGGGENDEHLLLHDMVHHVGEAKAKHTLNCRESGSDSLGGRVSTSVCFRAPEYPTDRLDDVPVAGSGVYAQ